MNPERYQPPTIETRQQAVAETFRAAMASERTEHVQLLPGAKFNIPNGLQFDAGTEKPDVGNQELLAFVKSGDAMFSITTFEPAESPGKISYFVNEIGTPDKPDRRARVYQAVPRDISADPIDQVQTGEQTSNPGVRVLIDKDGSLAIEASGNNNIDILFSAEAEEISDFSGITSEKTAAGGLRRFIQKFKGARELDNAEPIDFNDFRIWAPKTSDVAFIAKRQQKPSKEMSRQLSSDDLPKGKARQVTPGIIDSVPLGDEESTSKEKDLPPKKLQSAQQVESVASGETLEDLQHSFRSAEKAILEALKKPGTQEYYSKPRYQEQVSRKQSIEQELTKLRQKIEGGSLDSTERVILFGGIQSRNVSEWDEVKANVAVEWLYHNLCEVAGLGGRNYYDIEKMAEHANEKTAYRAITDNSGNIAGIRLDLGGGLFADFNIGNINDHDNIEKKMSSVRLEANPNKK